jgi:hypothetical protein
MSHFTEIKTQIKDIEALRSACQELGLTPLQDAAALNPAQPLLLNPSSRWYNPLTTNDKPAQEDEET